MSDDKPADDEEAEIARRARRRLLKMGVYAAPALLGLTLAAGDASAQPRPSTLARTNIRARAAARVNAGGGPP